MQHENTGESSPYEIDIDVLQEKVDNVLATMCFIVADPLPVEGVDECLQSCASAWLEFRRVDSAGCVRLTASPGFLEEAASGLLGLDPDEGIAESDGVDTLLELANVVGGEVLTLLGGEDVEFDVGIPSAAPPQTWADASNNAPTVAVAFDSMGESFRVEVL